MGTETNDPKADLTAAAEVAGAWAEKLFAESTKLCGHWHACLCGAPPIIASQSHSTTSTKPPQQPCPPAHEGRGRIGAAVKGHTSPRHIAPVTLTHLETGPKVTAVELVPKPVPVGTDRVSIGLNQSITAQGMYFGELRATDGTTLAPLAIYLDGTA